MAAAKIREVRFYGLLKLPPASEQMANLPPDSDPVDIYLRCAALCATSFAHFGYDWTLLTDNAELLEKRRRALGLGEFSLHEITFTREVPEDIPFHTAHYKLDVLDWFTRQDARCRHGLVDLDAVCLAPIPARLLQTGAITGYDISDAIPPGREDEVSRSFRLLLGEDHASQWWGGEFLMGRPQQFAQIMRTIDRIWPTYLAQHQAMHHVGDEMLVTAALVALRAAGGAVDDAGNAAAVHRYWSARTLNSFPPFSQIAHSAILHLPADKPFLASQSGLPFDPERFLAAYRRMLRRKIMVRRAASTFDRLRGRPATYPPRL